MNYFNIIKYYDCDIILPHNLPPTLPGILPVGFKNI